MFWCDVTAAEDEPKWLPSKAKELGLDFKSLKKLNPKIVLCSITGKFSC